MKIIRGRWITRASLTACTPPTRDFLSAHALFVNVIDATPPAKSSACHRCVQETQQRQAAKPECMRSGERLNTEHLRLP